MSVSHPQSSVVASVLIRDRRRTEDRRRQSGSKFDGEADPVGALEEALRRVGVIEGPLVHLKSEAGGQPLLEVAIAAVVADADRGEIDGANLQAGVVVHAISHGRGHVGAQPGLPGPQHEVVGEAGLVLERQFVLLLAELDLRAEILGGESHRKRFEQAELQARVDGPGVALLRFDVRPDVLAGQPDGGVLKQLLRVRDRQRKIVGIEGPKTRHGIAGAVDFRAREHAGVRVVERKPHHAVSAGGMGVREIIVFDVEDIIVMDKRKLPALRLRKARRVPVDRVDPGRVRHGRRPLRLVPRAGIDIEEGRPGRPGLLVRAGGLRGSPTGQHEQDGKRKNSFHYRTTATFPANFSPEPDSMRYRYTPLATVPPSQFLASHWTRPVPATSNSSTLTPSSEKIVMRAKAVRFEKVMPDPTVPSY